MNDKSVKIDVFCCATSYDQTQLMQNLSRQENEIKVISMPCSGKLDILYLIKAFETGADGAAVMICKEGECRYLEGNMRARKRVEVIEELLKETGLGEGRVAVIQMDERGIESAMRKLEDFRLKIKTLIKGSQTRTLKDNH